MDESNSLVPAPQGTNLPQTGVPDAEFLGKAFAAFASSIVSDGGVDSLIKGGQGKILQTKQPTAGPTSVFLDPWQLLGWQGSRIKNTTLNWGILREMARACKPIAAIIATRQNQVARYARLPAHRQDIGFRIRMRDMDMKPSGADKKRIKELERFVLQMGAAPAIDPNGTGKRPSFNQFLRMIVRDTLTLDAVAIEPRRTRRGDLFDLWPVDAGTIRYAGKDYKAKNAGLGSAGGITTFGRDVRAASGPVVYLQEYQGMIMTEYGMNDLAYEIRNPRTDIASNGYGFSELEILVETITSLLNADAYNAKYFTQNSLPEGVLSIVGNLSNQNLEAFKRAWQAQVSGVANAWKVPVIATPDGKGVNFTPFKLSNKDMQFDTYQKYLLQIACAVYQIDPAEIGFDVDTGHALSKPSNEADISHSQSKGFYPLMTFIETIMNERVLWELDDEFAFSWIGVDPDQQTAQHKNLMELVGNGIVTVRQYWKMFDMVDDYPDMMWPDCPVNTVLQTVFMQESGLLDQGGGEEGDEGDGPPGSEPPDTAEQVPGRKPPAGDEDEAKPKKPNPFDDEPEEE